jgi:hypothetical protein
VALVRTNASNSSEPERPADQRMRDVAIGIIRAVGVGLAI